MENLEQLNDHLMPLQKWASIIPECSEVKGSIRGLRLDSRLVRENDVFFAIKGTTQDGHDHLHEADERGAALLVGERPLEKHFRARYVFLPRLRYLISKLAGIRYDNPPHKLRVIGITGTCGKTTTSYLIECLMQSQGSTGRIGTNGVSGLDFDPKISNTTPDPILIQALLAAFYRANVKTVVMEVSSHALEQGRVEDIAFDAVCFTQLSPEHLDYHASMEAYFQAKSRLFHEIAPQASSLGKSPAAFIQTLEPYGKRLEHEIQASKQRLGIEPILKWHVLEESIHGLRGSFDKKNWIESSLFGSFNASNIALAASVAHFFKVPFPSMAEQLGAFAGVPGRLEKVENVHGIHAFVDYAHKPDAFERVLELFWNHRNRENPQSLIHLVFGCGGNRDRSKRAIMGNLAARYADRVWVTSDNPRYENPSSIVDEICSGIDHHRALFIEIDRAVAIEKAAQAAKDGDILLILGKGHEKTQEIQGQKRLFDDREFLIESFKKRVFTS